MPRFRASPSRPTAAPVRKSRPSGDRARPHSRGAWPGMSYVHIKYQRNFESISEEKLAEQISYWFFVNLLYQPLQKNNTVNIGIKSLDPIFETDIELKKWFLVFFKESTKYFQSRYNVLKNSKI